MVGVEGGKWPNLSVQRFNEVTDESYLNPAFEGTVITPINNRLIVAVAKEVSCQLNRVRVLPNPSLVLHC